MRGFVSEAPDPQWSEEVLTPELLKEIRLRCPELETLIIHEHFGVAFKVGPFCKHQKEIYYIVSVCDVQCLQSENLC